MMYSICEGVVVLADFTSARENQDTACLSFALSWLLYLRHAHPDKSRSSFATISGAVGSGGGEHDEIAFLKQKARDGKHWVLLSNTLLEEAKLEMFNVRGEARI